MQASACVTCAYMHLSTHLRATQKLAEEFPEDSCRLAGVAVAIQSNPWNARTYFMNDLVDQVIRSTLLFASAGCFRRVADSSGEHPGPVDCCRAGHQCNRIALSQRCKLAGCASCGAVCRFRTIHGADHSSRLI